MALIFADRVRDTSTVEGVADIVLTGVPVTGHKSFNSAVGTGNSCYYCVDDMNGTWEVGIGTYTHSTLTLTRDTIYSSSDVDTQVSFGVGTKQVYLVCPAREVGSNAIYTDTSTGTQYRIQITDGSIVKVEV